MTPRTVLPHSGLNVSRIGLGLSRLHHIWWERDRCRLINEALDLGVTHFDAARLYGDGIAERSLGKALKGHRSEVTVSTKFGLLPNDFAGALGSMARPIWAVRQVRRRLGKSRWAMRSFTTATMKQSLALSLRLLQTDHIDVLFLHEPYVEDLENNPSLIEALLKAKKAGKTRFLGLAGADYNEIETRLPGVFDVIQSPESDWNPDKRIPDFTYSVVSSRRDELRQGGANAVRGVLAAALRRRPDGGILVGTSRIEHLREAVHASNEAAA